MLRYGAVLWAVASLVATGARSWPASSSQPGDHSQIDAARPFKSLPFFGGIDSGPDDLARQRAAARQEGMPLTPQDLSEPLPPVERNAAPIYLQISRLLDEKPLDSQAIQAAIRIGHRWHSTPTDLALARKLLSDRRDVMTLVHQASAKPDCFFQHDWSLGSSLRYPETFAARNAAYLIHAESVLMALDAHYGEAIANQALGFNISRHLASDRYYYGNQVGIACENVALFGMGDILYQAGPDRSIAGQVQQSIAAHRNQFDFGRGLEADFVISAVDMKSLHQGGFRALRAFMSPAVQAALPPMGEFETEAEMTPEVRQLWHKFVDAGEADLLDQYRYLINASRKPYPERRVLLKRFDDALQTYSPRLVNIIRITWLGFSYAETDAKRVTVQAYQEIVTAGAAVLDFRGRTGRWPSRLEAAISPVPMDPFSGRPLPYRREGNGFVVYSVGVDGRYTGGKPGIPRDRLQSVFRYPAPPPASPVAPAPPRSATPR